MAARTYCVTFLIIGLHSVLGAGQRLPPTPKRVETRYCAYYNGSQPTCDPNDPTCVPTIQREDCMPIEDDKSNHCFHLWQYDNATKSSTLRLKGCYVDTVACDRSSPCRIHNAKLMLLTCCCEGDMCNTNDTLPSFLLSPQDKIPEETPSPADHPRKKNVVVDFIYNVYLFISNTYISMIKG